MEFVEYTLRPWLVRWEQELNRKLFPGPSEFTVERILFVEHNVDGLLRGDFASRMTGYARGRQWGWISVNDIREKENMNPLPGNDGDQYLVPTNMTTPELLANPPKPVSPAPLPLSFEWSERIRAESKGAGSMKREYRAIQDWNCARIWASL